MTRVRLKKAVEPPAQVREIVDKVTNTPFDALPDVLDGFTWRFEKGDFNHWATLFNYFDELLERALATRHDLHLNYECAVRDPPFPSRSVLAILRVSATILENCSNKHLYHSYEHLTSLLAAPDPAVVIATLQTLVAFVRKTHASSVRWHGWPDLNSRLLALSQGWGGKEEGLDLAVCTQSDEAAIRPCLSLGTTLNFQFYVDASDASRAPADGSEPSGLRVINLQNLDRYQEREHDILRQLVERFAVPEKLRFPLLARITVARKFGTLEGRRHLARLRLLSLHILFQCNPSPDAVAEFYSQEPEFVSDLVCLLVGGAAIPEDLRILALRVLAVQLLDRTHHTGVISAISSGGQSGLLSMLMHRSIASVAAGAAAGEQPEYSVQFVDALLTLVGALSASTSGCSALAEAGSLSALMPMLKDADPAHTGLVASAVRILEAFLDFSPNSATQFREMGGLTDMIDRLMAEVGLPRADQARPDQAAPAAAGPEDMQMDAPAPSAAAQRPGHAGKLLTTAEIPAPQPGVLISYQRRVLLKALLRTIALTSYAPGASGRPQEEDHAALYACLRRIFERSTEFGGGLFALAASVMTDQIHHEPLSFNALEEAGLPEAFLNAIKAGVLPSGEAVCAVPSTLVALCLNEKGLERVKESKALDCFVPIFTTPTYLRALQFQGDTPSALGSNFDELMRHVNSLRNDTLDMVLTIFRKLCEIGGQTDKSQSEQEDTGTSASAQPMDTDDGKPAEAAPADVDMSGAAASPKAGSDRHANWHPHVAECIMHSARLLETMLSNQNFSRQFVERGGLQLLLKLYTLKHLPPTFGSSGASHAVMAVFRTCTQLHGPLVTEKVAEALAEHLRTALLLAMSIGRSALQDVDAKRRDEYTRCVSSLEGVTSLASAVSRSSMAMLNEVSKAGRFAGLKTLVLDEPIPEHALAVENVAPTSAIIARIGDLERIVHLQIALAESRKAEMEAEGLLEAATAEVAQKAPAQQEQLPGLINDDLPGMIDSRSFEEVVGGMSMAPQPRTLRNATLRATQGLLPGPSRALLLAAESERMAEDGDIVDPPAAGSPRDASGGHKNGKKKSGEDLALEVLTHFAATVRGFYSSLTKSIHTPLRRREEGLPMTPAIRSTALHLGLVMKMNCEGVGIRHWDGSGPELAQGAEASSSSGSSLPAAAYMEWSQWRARYLSAMVDGLAAVLFDNRRGTCHCLMLNYWVRCGGLQAFLAQFGTAAQFLWDVTAADKALGSAPADQMEELPSTSEDIRRTRVAEKKRVGRVRERAETLLSSMLALLNQLADSARILNSPLSSSLLVIPLNDEDLETNAAWSSAENLVKSLKSAILDAVLPVWSSPSLASCSPQNTGAVTSILKHCTEAVSAPASRPGNRGAPPPDPAIVQQVVEMGFGEERVREALRRVGHNSVELAMEWLINHPEELMEAAPTAPAPQADQVPAVAKAINLAPAQALLKPKNEAPSTEQLVDGAVSVLEQVPSAAFSLADLLKSHSAQQGRREDEAVLTRLLQRLHSAESFAETVAARPAVGLLGPAHLLALLCDEDPGMRRAGAKTGLPSVALGLLEAWVAAHATKPSALKGLDTADVAAIPRWVDALLLVLDACTHIDWQAPLPEAAVSAPEQPSASDAAAPEAEQGMDVDAPAAAEQPADPSAPAADQAGASEQPTASAAADTKKPAEHAPLVEDVFRKLPKHEGILSEEEQDRAMRVAMALLRHLHAWGAVYEEPTQPLTEAAALQQPNPPSSAQGVLLLLSCLTKRHSIALKVLAGRGPKLILEVPLACFTPDLEPYISAIMRHILEDPVTLQAAMEAEIRSTLSKGRRTPKPSSYASGSQQTDGSMPVRQFLQTCAAVINREPTVFFEAVLGICTIRENNGRPLVVLKKAKADGAKASDDKKDADAPSGGPPDSGTGGAAGGAGASGPSANTPAPQGNAPSSSGGGAGGSAAGGSTLGPSGSGAPPHRRDSGIARRHGGAGGGTPGGGTPGGGPPGGGPGGGGSGGGGGKTPKDRDKDNKGRSGKKVPSSFVEVIDTLVDLVIRYEGPTSESKPKDASTGASAMNTDTPAPQPSTSEAPAPSAVGGASTAAPQSVEQVITQLNAQMKQTAQARTPEQKQEEKDLMVQCIALKMLTEFTLMYNACVGVLLKRDVEGTRGRGSSPPSTPAAPKADSPQSLLFRHVMHRHLVFIPEPEVSMQGLGEQASFFLMAICIRSAEGRKRITLEIVRTLSANTDQKPPAGFGRPSAAALAAIPFKQKAGFPPPYKVKAFVELAGSLLSAGAAKSQAGQPTGLSGEMLRCMRSSGVINALIGALKLVDMDHPNAVKSIGTILKPLEILTRSLPASMLTGFGRHARQARLFNRTALGSAAASEPEVERALAALEGPSSGDEPMRDAQEDSAAAGPEAVAAAERLRQAFEREQNGDNVENLARSVESVMEQIIEQAYGEDGMEGFPESDSEGDGTDEDVIESEEDDAMGEEPMPEMTDEEDEDLDGDVVADLDDDDEDDDDERQHHRHHHHDSADHSVYSDDDESSSDESGDEDHEVEVLFDDIEEDAMVGPLLGEADQLLMEHGGDENGSTEDEDDLHDGADEDDEHGHYDDGDEDDDVDDEDEGDMDGDGEDFGVDDLPAMEDHEFLLGEDDDGLLAWPEEDGMMGEEVFHPNPHPPRWVGIPRMNGTHNLARAGAAAQHNAVELMVNELLNTGALGGIQVDGRDQRFRYRMRTTQQNGAPSAGGVPGAAGSSRHRLLQRPAAVPGVRSAADEARSANEMRILRMNQPFPTVFAPDDTGNPGEYWMITADNGQQGFSAGPRNIVLQSPNAASLIDFSADMMRGAGAMAAMSNWSDDGQPPSAMESTQLAGQLEQSLVETLRQHASPEEPEDVPAAAAAAEMADAQPAAVRALELAAGELRGEDLNRVRLTLERQREELQRTQADMNARHERNQQIVRQMDDMLRNASPNMQSILNSSGELRQALDALNRAGQSPAPFAAPRAPAEAQTGGGPNERSAAQSVAAPARSQAAAGDPLRASNAPSTAQNEELRLRAAGGLFARAGELLGARNIRTPDDVPDALRETWERLILTYGDTTASRQGVQLPSSTSALTDPQVEIIRQSLRDRVGGRLRESGSEAAAAQFERFVADFDPRNVAHVPEDMRAMISAIENTAQAEPVTPMIAPGGPRSAGIPPGGPLLAALEQLRARAPPVTPAPGDAPADRAIRRQPPGPPPLAGEQTPAATASAAFPPPAPRRTRYQARLRGVPPQDAAEREAYNARLRAGLAPSILGAPHVPAAPQPAVASQPPAAIGADLFSSAMSAAMSGLTGAAPPAPSLPQQASAQPAPSAARPLIGADLLSAALSGAAAPSASGDGGDFFSPENFRRRAAVREQRAAALEQPGRDVEMADAEPSSEAAAEIRSDSEAVVEPSPPGPSRAAARLGGPANLARALEGTGIDPDVFDCMPPALQQEVLGDAVIYRDNPAADSEEAAQLPGSSAPERSQPMETAQPEQEAAAEPASSAGPAEGEPPTSAAGPSAQEGSDDDMAGIDPEFLAALPEELQAEVLEAQRRERRQRRAEAEHAAAQAAAASGEGGPQELDLATTLASFPPEVRDEVLMTADEEMLAQLPPAILAEAQALRERAHGGRPGSRHLGGGAAMPSSLSDATMRGLRERRRGELAGQLAGAAAGARMAAAIGRRAGFADFAMDRIQATVDSHMQQSLLSLNKGGTPGLQGYSPVKVDDDALVTLISLLRVSSPLVKQHLQRLFLNLCEDKATMESTLRILLSLLRAPLSADEARAARQEPKQQLTQPASLSAALQAGEGMAVAEEAPELLPLVQLGILGRGATAVPPAMTRRILELVTHLAKHTSKGAYEMIGLKVPLAEDQAALLLGMQDKKGKGKAVEEGDVAKDSKVGLDVLLELLSKTLCKRSTAHLEAALNTIEVTLSLAKRHDALSDKTTRGLLLKALEHDRDARRADLEAHLSPASIARDQRVDRARLEAMLPSEEAAGAAGAAARPATPASAQQDPPSTPAAQAGRQSLDEPASARQSAGPARASSDAAIDAIIAANRAPRKPMLEGVDQELLRQLPRLLGQGSLSDTAYKRAAKCIRLLVLCSADSKTPMLNELESELHKLSGEAVRELRSMVAGTSGSGPVVNMGVGALGSRVLCICEVIGALINPKGVKDQTPLVQLIGGQDIFKDKEVDPRDMAGLEELISRTEPLWAALSDAIAVLEADLANTHPAGPADAANPNRILSPGATQVLPLVKAFFVLCEPRTSHLPPPVSMRRRSSTSVSMDLSLAPVTSEETASQGASPDGKPLEAQLPFLRFAERHRRLVNVLIQQNVQLLLEGPLTQLMRTPRLIDFDNKRAFFRSQVRSSSDRYHGSLRIHVRREHIFEDSFHQLRSKTPDEMRGKLSVQFHSEEGIDAGGVTREWYQVMARETFNPNISLFVPTGGSTFQPNPNSIVQNDEARGTNHLDFFKFVGRVVGKALYDGQLIDAYFTRSFYKHMLGQPLTYQDIEGVDPEYYKNLTWLLEHDMTDVVDLNFVEEVDYFGRVEHVELKPGGRDIKVTNENKREYVDLVAEHRMTTAIRAQIQAFLKGFWEMVPRDLISMFNDHELELLISGLPEIDVDDLRANTEYQGFTANSPVIQYFWEVVREMDKEDLALLVQFVTGTSKVPLEGFKALQGIGGPQKFQIHKAYGSQQKLPAAHTCFNQLDLVEYESKEQLRDRLMLALHEGATGFGFG